MQVTSKMVEAAIEGANICLHELKQAANELNSNISSTGIGQDDDHYAQLLSIVNKCVMALEAPQANLTKNISTLKTIQEIVIKKENHSIT